MNRRLFAATTIAATLFSTIALAGPEQDREADERFAKGMEAARQGHGEQARLFFLEAYSVDPQSPKTLWNLAAVEVETRHYVEALKHFRAYLKTPGVTARDREVAQKLMDRAYAATGHVRIEGALGATIRVDADVAVTHARHVEEIDVEPGHHRLVAKHGGAEEELDIDAGAGRAVDVKFTKIEKPPAAQSGPVARDPSRTLVEPEHPPAARTVTLVLGGVTVAALAVGVVTGLIATSKKEDGNRLHDELPPAACDSGRDPRCVALADAVDSQRTHATISTGFFIGAGVLGAATAVSSYFWLTSRKEGPRLTLTASPTSAGLQVIGTF